MNLAGLQQVCYDRLDYDSATVAAGVTSRLNAYMNEGQRWILVQKGCSFMRRDPSLTFVSVANSPFAVLPQAAVKVWSVFDRTNMKLLDEITLQELRTSDPGLQISSSFPYAYVVQHVAAAVAKDPSVGVGGSQLFFKSTAAGDGATKRVTVEGYTASGEYFVENVALNGVTAVNTTRTTILHVSKFYLSLAAGGATTAAGDITMLDNSNVGPELSRIFITRNAARYTRLQLYPTPSAAVTYNCDVDLKMEDMAQAGDEPYLPEDFHWLLASYGLMREFQKRRWLEDAATEKALFTSGLRDLKVRLAQPSGADNADQRRQRISQLGPYFPAGS